MSCEQYMYILLLNQCALGSAVYFWYISGFPPVTITFGVLVGVVMVVGVFVAPLCTVIVNTWVDFAPQAFVYVAVYVFVPVLKAIARSSRDVDVNPFGPVQLHDPPVAGWGPRFTVAGSDATVTLLVCCHAPVPTCR